MFYFGVDYYPEHWPEERWPEDARLMSEAGMNIVRLAEFAWSRMEPEDGRFDFDWLDRALAILNRHGIQAVLGTPTASPPPWLMQNHPEIFRGRIDGLRMTYGNRREYCPNNPIYHDYSRRIVEKMAAHYASHPGVIGWQIDNEFGDRCFCPVCRQKFQQWLKERYPSLDDLNAKWGTVFWSHVYNDWSEIPVPLSTGGSPNPGLGLEFSRFSSDSYVAYQKMQVDILRQLCPGHFITHNFMGFGYDLLNYFDLAKDLDLVAWDNYPRTQWRMEAEVPPSRMALGHDTMRGLKGKNFWMMEQQAGPGGWELVSVPPRPGELRLWAYQAIAHGADGMVFFRWRTARFGTEEYWHGLLDHDGTPGRRYQEIKEMGAEIKKVGDQILGAAVKPSIALLLSYDSRFAFQIQGNNPGFSYYQHFHDVYTSFFNQNVMVDIISGNEDLSPYQVIVAPALHVLKQELADRLVDYVKSGGVLVLTPRTGVKDDFNTVVNQRLPGLLKDLYGVEVEEYDSLALDMSNEVEFTLPELSDLGSPQVKAWCDVLRPVGSSVVGKYTQDYYAGKPAITLHKVGKGSAIYVGAMGADLYQSLAVWLLELGKLKSIMPAQAGLEVTERWQDNRRLLFILNHTNRDQSLELEGRYVDLLSGKPGLTGTISVPPHDLKILSTERRGL